MNIEDLLSEQEPVIVEEAVRATAEIGPYRRDGAVERRRRIGALHRRLTEAVTARDLTGLLAYVRQIASERSAAGFELSDVQAAFTALEDAIWHRAVTRLPSYDVLFGEGMVCTALAHGRDTLRRAFDSAAPHVRAPCPDLTSLFKGTESSLARVPAEGMNTAVSAPRCSRKPQRSAHRSAAAGRRN
jgi:hypothetical protein